jgi:chromosome partitioning protein
MAQVVSVINMKGGVGKTTLAVNVAYALAYHHKKKVLLVDVDPQFNASTYLLSEKHYLAHIGDQKKGTVLDIFVPRRPGPVNTVSGASKPTNRVKMSLSACTCPVYAEQNGAGKLDLIPSTLALMEIETSKRGTENKLNNFICEKGAAYDYVILDCPPTISIFTQAAILASQKYLVPIKPDPLSVIGLPLLERWMTEFTDDAGVTVESVGLVFTLVRGPTPSRMAEAMSDLRRERKAEVFAAYLSEATAVAESVEAHRPVFLYRSNSKAANQILEIAEEFLNRTSGA